MTPEIPLVDERMDVRPPEELDTEVLDTWTLPCPNCEANHVPGHRYYCPHCSAELPRRNVDA